MIREILLNRILFVIVPVVFFMTIYVRYKLGLDGFRIEFLDIFILFTIIGSYWSVSSIKRVLKLRAIRNRKIVEGLTITPNLSKINYPCRTSFFEYDIITTSKDFEIYREKKTYVEVNKSKKSIKINLFLCKRTFLMNDIKFLLLEYHRFHEYTFKGWISRGQLDNFKYQNAISIVLHSGRIVELISGSLEESVYKNDLRELTNNPYGHLPKDQAKNYLGIGERTVSLLCNELKLGYVVIDYSKEMLLQNSTLDSKLTDT